MKRFSGVITGVALAGAAVVVAGPANADDPSGTYLYLNAAGNHTMTWSISSCGPACINVISDAAPGVPFDGDSQDFEATATKEGNRWTMDTSTPEDWVGCGYATSFSWDGDSLSGTLTGQVYIPLEPWLDGSDWCESVLNGGDPLPFTLTKA